MRTITFSSGIAALLLIPLTVNAQSTPQAEIPTAAILPAMDCIVEPSQMVEISAGVSGIIDKFTLIKTISSLKKTLSQNLIQG